MPPDLTSKRSAKSQRIAISSWNFTACGLSFVISRSSCMPPLIQRLILKPSVRARIKPPSVRKGRLVRKMRAER
jgi:hypothetical protein